MVSRRLSGLAAALSRRSVVVAALVWLCLVHLPSRASAVPIDNGIPAGVVGHVLFDVLTGGNSNRLDVTARRLSANDVVTDNVMFAYLTFVDPGINGAGVVLSGTAPVQDSDDPTTVRSSGTFGGQFENTIAWTAATTLPPGSRRATTTYTFTAQSGPLGPLRLLQYMDEDVESSGDNHGFANDVFFIRGTVADATLELFTVDDVDVYGVSHSGALSPARGLVNATFAGWAADVYNNNNMVLAIQGDGQPVSLDGTIANLSQFVHPQVGQAWGPADIVSVLAWDVDPTATTATIITSIGGVPDVLCGDGRVDEGEQCDDGNDVPCDGCTQCRIDACGDGTLCPNEGEQCDDGNTMSLDGCSATCQIENRCGDGHLDAGETCDDGNTTSGDGCSATCQIEGHCGDGHVDADEQCDEGTANGTDGSCCDKECHFQPATTVCRAAAGDCDVAERCSGASGACPADGAVPEGTACVADPDCSVAGTCSGTSCEDSPLCTGVVLLPNGEPKPKRAITINVQVPPPADKGPVTVVVQGFFDPSVQPEQRVHADVSFSVVPVTKVFKTVARPENNYAVQLRVKPLARKLRRLARRHHLRRAQVDYHVTEVEAERDLVTVKRAIVYTINL